MVKKLQAIANGKDESSPLATAIRESAEKIWLAGLGAFAKARQEPTRAFETLVRDGLSLQSRTRTMASERIEEVSDKVNAMKDQLSARATDSWDKLEQVFEDRVSRSLARLGVPSRHEVQALTDQVDALTEALTALGGQLPTARARRSGSRTGGRAGGGREASHADEPAAGSATAARERRGVTSEAPVHRARPRAPTQSAKPLSTRQTAARSAPANPLPVAAARTAQATARKAAAATPTRAGKAAQPGAAPSATAVRKPRVRKAVAGSPA